MRPPALHLQRSRLLVLAFAVLLTPMSNTLAQGAGHLFSKDPVTVRIHNPVPVEGYFHFMDSLVRRYDSLTAYPLSEHMLVRANPWILDTLAHTDYYYQMARDSFVYDQRKMTALPRNGLITIPDSATAFRILDAMGATHLDVNIPEFALRILQDSSELFRIPIRVGQNRKRFLEMSGAVTDLRTRTGTGTIIRHEKNPAFFNPVDGKRFYTTKRDDGKRTLMPLIPWIETEIDGRRNGQLIHPTTNPETLGKAYSNGCIGTGEADAWRVYYYAPIGTPIRIRYDLYPSRSSGSPPPLMDIYGYLQGRSPDG